MRVLADGARERRVEILPRAEEAGIEEFLQRPEVGRAVLERRARERDLHGDLQRAGGAGGARVGVLDRLRLVEDERGERRVREVAKVAHEERVARHHHVRPPARHEERPARRARAALVEQHLQARRERAQLAHPVRRDGDGRDDEGGRLRRFPPRVEEVGDRLHRLAEAHVVRQTRTEPPLREEGEPGHPAQLVVAERPLQPLRLRQHPEPLLAAQFVEEPPQPAMRLHLRDAQTPHVPRPEREGDGLGGRERLPLHGLQRPQRLAQHVAVHLDPAVAEEDERGPLVEQELDLPLRHLLPVDADRELRGDRAGGGRSRGGGRQLGLGDEVFARHTGRHRHDEPRRRERLRARPQEVLGIGVRQLGAHPAQGPERRIDGGGLAEGNQPPPRRGHGADLQVPRRLRRLRRHEPEAQRRPLGGRHGERRAPVRERTRERAQVVRPLPPHAPRVAPQRSQPGVVDRLVPPRVVLQRGPLPAPHEAVDAVREERHAGGGGRRDTDRPPAREERPLFLLQRRQILPGGHHLRRRAEHVRRAQDVLAEENALPQAPPAHVREEHQQVGRRGHKAVRPRLRDPLLVPQHLAHGGAQGRADERHGRRAGRPGRLRAEGRAPPRVDLKVQFYHVKRGGRPHRPRAGRRPPPPCPPGGRGSCRRRTGWRRPGRRGRPSRRSRRHRPSRRGAGRGRGRP